VEAVFHATYTHSRNLAVFVVAYKALTLLLRGCDGRAHQYHAFIAAFIGGLLVFGRYNKINEQVRAFCFFAVLSQNVFLCVACIFQSFSAADCAKRRASDLYRSQIFSFGRLMLTWSMTKQTQILVAHSY